MPFSREEDFLTNTSIEEDVIAMYLAGPILNQTSLSEGDSSEGPAPFWKGDNNEIENPFLQNH